MTKENKCVAIYIRVSTLDQAEQGYSLEAQEKTLRRWCGERSYEVFDLYADKGISGKDIKHRPDMNRLLRDAKEKKFNIVLFWALSRFTRSVSDLYNTMENFQKWDIDMISYTESFDTSTSMGRAMIGIVGVFSQLERELTSERVSAALTERASQGKRTCSEILGYDLDGRDSFTINENEAEYVRFCFNEYLLRKNLSRVAYEANKRGYKGKRGKKPTAWSVQKILTRTQYCGYNTFLGEVYKGNYESIIDVETFEKVSMLLEKQGKSIGRKRDKIYVNQITVQNDERIKTINKTE